MGIWLLLILSLPTQPPPASEALLELTLLPAPWPAQPRVVGYEYHQKDHHSPPEFLPGPAADHGRSGAETLRVVGIRLHNFGDRPRDARLRSPQIADAIQLSVPPRTWITRYFVIPEPPDATFEAELGNPATESWDRSRVALPPGKGVTRDPQAAGEVAAELNREDEVRRAFQLRPVSVSVHDAKGRGIEGVRLLLLHEDTDFVAEGETDPHGTWIGPALPGAYQAYAFGFVDGAAVLLESALHPDLPGAVLRPDREVIVDARIRDGGPLGVRRLWVTPEPLTSLFRFATVAEACAKRARLMVTASADTPLFRGELRLLTTIGLASRVAVVAEDGPFRNILLRGHLTGETQRLELDFDPASMARLLLDPTTGPGPGALTRAEIIAVEDGLREKLSLETRGFSTLFIPPGAYRVDVEYHFFGDGKADYLPFILRPGKGDAIDLTPRAPFRLTSFYKRRQDEESLQFWLAIEDAYGKILETLPAPGGKVIGKGSLGRSTSRGLVGLRWGLRPGRALISPKNVVTEVYVPFGGEFIHGKPRTRETGFFRVEGANGDAPPLLEGPMKALLGEIKSTLDGCDPILGLHTVSHHLTMNFDFMMPPGLGGLGGGGRITFGLDSLFPFAHASDSMPRHFHHELGHNLGIGHDPYMLLAETALDEARWGALGYRMVHAQAVRRALSYLETERSAETAPWKPNRTLFPALRLLFGPGVHRQMTDQRRRSEKTLGMHGLSSIERIAALYSLPLDRNVAWVFRSHGWPVFDARIDTGARAVRTITRHPPPLNYRRVEGAVISSWWVAGPFRSGAPVEEPARWRRVVWPDRFVFVDEDRPPAPKEMSALFFRRIAVARETRARILLTADVQAEVRVNGTAVGYADAAPQFWQPMHDDLGLDRKKRFPVRLPRGESTIEVAVRQPYHTKGFLLELVTPDGRPVPVTFVDAGPGEGPHSDEVTRLPRRSPIFNGGFESGSDLPTAWIHGPNEGAIEASLDESVRREGARSLRLHLVGPARGGLIQRIVVKPGTRYRLRGEMRTAGLKGKAHFAFFTGDIHENQGRVLGVDSGTSSWQKLSSSWNSGPSRVIYVACYVDAVRGTVWFDGIDLREER